MRFSLRFVVHVMYAGEVSTMSPDAHRCLFYDGLDDLLRQGATLIREGERAGLKWLYVLGDIGSGEIRRTLAGLMPRRGETVEAGALGLLDSVLNFEAVIERIRAESEAAQRGGFSGLLLLIDMSWRLHTASGIANQGEFEAALHGLLGRLPVRAVCLYSRRLFQDAMLLDALRTHPCVHGANGPYANPHFLPPRTFLSRDPREMLRCWLETISPALAKEWVGREGTSGAAVPASASASATGMAAEEPLPDVDWTALRANENCGQQRWKIRCLGNLRVYRQDGAPVRWNRVNGAALKTKTLFAYLLHCGQRGAEAEEIADLLWPRAKTSKQSLNRLYHTIHCLRMALSPDLGASRDSPFVLSLNRRYYLALPEATWIDVPVFEQYCRRGEKLLRDNRLEESLICHLAAEKLYTGGLLADIPVEYAESTDKDWCWSQRYWLEEMYVKMLNYMAGIHRRGGSLELAVAYGEKAIRIDPCFEGAHQELMRAFQMLGRRDALERQYRLCGGALQRYQERKPSLETQELYRSLVARSSARAAAAAAPPRRMAMAAVPRRAGPG
jgi:two-component SAPR family response regulator